MATLPDTPPPVFEEEPRSAPPPAGGPSLGGLAALVLGNAILAVGPWLVRLSGVPPVVSGFWRLALALPLVLLIAVARRRTAPPVTARALLVAGAGGLFFALDLAAWHSGIVRTRLANATLFGNVTSFFFVAYGFLVTRSLPDRVQATAIGLAVAGVALLLGRSFELSRAHLAGDLLCLLAGATYTGYMVAVDRLRGRLGTWATLGSATFAAAAVLLALVGVEHAPLWPRDWRPLLALAVGSQVIGQALIIFAIGNLPSMMVGLGLLTQPVVASAIGWIAYDERLGIVDLLGALAIAAALVLVRRRAAG
ncbi:DMT family transporter [Sphingomonas sp.]|uniref:DMT family transporter n=1 Tax=Sphingomonas sp. TaxID=28214 RepID=UPI003B00FAE4